MSVTMLFHCQSAFIALKLKGNLRMRRDSYIVRPKPSVKPQQSLISCNLLEAVKHALIR